MNPSVAASRQSAAGCCSHELRRSTETPLRGDGSWEASFRFCARIGTINHSLTRPPATLSPAEGERDGVRGQIHGQPFLPRLAPLNALVIDLRRFSPHIAGYGASPTQVKLRHMELSPEFCQIGIFTSIFFSERRAPAAPP